MLATLFPVMWPRSSLRQWHVYCWYAGDTALAVFLSLSSGPDAPHSDTVWNILGDSFLECFVFSAVLGLTVETFLRQSTVALSPEEYGIIGSFSGVDLKICSQFFVMLGSTADTYCVSLRWLVSVSETGQCLSSVVHVMRQSRIWCGVDAFVVQVVFHARYCARPVSMDQVLQNFVEMPQLQFLHGCGVPVFMLQGALCCHGSGSADPAGLFFPPQAVFAVGAGSGWIRVDLSRVARLTTDEFVAG